MALTDVHQRSWDERGFFIIRGFAEQQVLDEMIERVRELAGIDRDARPDLMWVDDGTNPEPDTPAEGLSKLFRMMRTEEVFRRFATDPRLLDILAEILDGDFDCFLSQFIFKHPGTLGQPMHQDDFYFHMTPLPQVGVWLACTAATPENGPLWVVPGSHTEKIHEALPDERPGASPAYVEIIGAPDKGEELVLMEPGDLLLFHSRLRHKSTDNKSDGMRAAMVFHYAVADTEGWRGYNHDWTPVWRDGAPSTFSTDPTPVVT